MADGDTTIVGGTETTVAGDVPVNKGLCDCCGTPPAGCTRSVTLGCPDPWPDAVAFTLSTITDPSDLSPDDLRCCSFNHGALPDCLNRTWGVPTADFSNPPDGCSQDYEFSCSNPPMEDDIVYPGLDVQVSHQVSFETDTTAHTITVILFIRAHLHNGANGYYCHAARLYKHVYTFDDFPCDGPWNVDDTGGAGVQPNDVGGWPATITLTGTDTPTTDCCAVPETGTCGTPATFNCVDGTCVDPGDGTGFYTGPTALADCEAPGACHVATTYNCDAITHLCTDPGDGTGFFTGLTALADCNDACSPTYNCVDHVCIDPHDGSGLYTGPTALTDCNDACGRYSCIGGVCVATEGGTYPDRAACEAAPCPPPTRYDCSNGVCFATEDGFYGSLAECTAPGVCPPGGDTRPFCCPTGTPDQLIMIVTVDDPLCGCLNSGQNIVWAGSSYGASFAACGGFVRYKLSCVPDGTGTGSWIAEVFCSAGGNPEALVAAVPVTVGGTTASGSDTTLATACCGAGSAIHILITPVGGGPGPCDG